MEAARLLIGRSAADGIRNDMGDHWLNVAIAAHLAESQDQGEWSPVHATLKSWLDYQADRLDAAEYNQRLVEHAEDVRGQYLRIH